MQWISIRLTLPWGLVLGILAGGMIATSFDPVLTLTFVALAAMRGILIYLVYVASKRGLYPSNPLPVMSIALVTGFAITFVGSILVGPTPIFQTLAVIAIINAPVYIAYRIIQFLKIRRELSVPVRNLVRNIFAVLFVMVPLLLFLSISYWTILLVVLNSLVLFNFFRDRRRTGNVAPPSFPSGR